MSRRIRRTNWVVTALIVIILTGSIIITYENVKKEGNNNYEPQASLLTSSLISKMENGQFPKSHYFYINYNLSGTICHMNGSLLSYQKGDHIKPLEMVKEIPNYYVKTAAIEENGEMRSITIFYIQKNEFNILSRKDWTFFCLLPLLIGSSLILFLLIIRSYFVSKRILTPLEQVSQSAKAMIAGNYDLEVQRVYGERLREDEIGDLIYSFELMRDELKEKQLREKELKKSSQQLISCISHDLRTPIATIQAYSEGLRDGIASNEEERQHYVEVMIKKTHLLTDMIHELLEYSNAKLNHLSIGKKEIYFKQYYNRLLAEIKPYVEHERVTFIGKPLSEDILVTIDEKRISEVIYNLIDNSLKYKKEDHNEIEITCELEEGELWIRVKDKGIGIRANDIPHVFDQFYHAEKSRSTSVKGSGLGLSICKYIVEQHGGTIYCRSRKNEGCEIGFSLRL